jgi:hypothetical protein
MGKVNKTGWCGPWTESVPEEPEEGQGTTEAGGSAALEIAKDIPKNRGRAEDGTRLPCRPRGTSKLQCLWDRAIVALLNNSTVAAAAKEIGVSPNALGEWLNNPEFASQLNKVRLDGMGVAALSLQGRWHRAIDRLYELVDDPNCPAAVNYAAAKTIMEMNKQLVIEERTRQAADMQIQRLEKIVSGSNDEDEHSERVEADREPSHSRYRDAEAAEGVDRESDADSEGESIEEDE